MGVIRKRKWILKKLIQKWIGKGFFTKPRTASRRRAYGEILASLTNEDRMLALQTWGRP